MSFLNKLFSWILPEESAPNQGNKANTEPVVISPPPLIEPITQPKKKNIIYENKKAKYSTVGVQTLSTSLNCAEIAVGSDKIIKKVEKKIPKVEKEPVIKNKNESKPSLSITKPLADSDSKTPAITKPTLLTGTTNTPSLNLPKPSLSLPKVEENKEGDTKPSLKLPTPAATGLKLPTPAATGLKLPTPAAPKLNDAAPSAPSISLPKFDVGKIGSLPKITAPNIDLNKTPSKDPPSLKPPTFSLTKAPILPVKPVESKEEVAETSQEVKADIAESKSVDETPKEETTEQVTKVEETKEEKSNPEENKDNDNKIGTSSEIKDEEPKQSAKPSFQFKMPAATGLKLPTIPAPAPKLPASSSTTATGFKLPAVPSTQSAGFKLPAPPSTQTGFKIPQLPKVNNESIPPPALPAKTESESSTSNADAPPAAPSANEATPSASDQSLQSEKKEEPQKSTLSMNNPPKFSFNLNKAGGTTTPGFKFDFKNNGLKLNTPSFHPAATPSIAPPSNDSQPAAPSPAPTTEAAPAPQPTTETPAPAPAPTPPASEENKPKWTLPNMAQKSGATGWKLPTGSGTGWGPTSGGWGNPSASGWKMGTSSSNNNPMSGLSSSISKGWAKAAGTGWGAQAN